MFDAMIPLHLTERARVAIVGRRFARKLRVDRNQAVEFARRAAAGQPRPRARGGAAL